LARLKKLLLRTTKLKDEWFHGIVFLEEKTSTL
jgi:hypothetical protein